LKCHGAFSPLIFESSRNVGASLAPCRSGISIALPHEGHLPSLVTAEGAK